MLVFFSMNAQIAKLSSNHNKEIVAFFVVMARLNVRRFRQVFKAVVKKIIYVVIIRSFIGMNDEKLIVMSYQLNNLGSLLRQPFGSRTSIASSTVMIPKMSPSLSTTGRASRLYSAIF